MFCMEPVLPAIGFHRPPAANPVHECPANRDSGPPCRATGRLRDLPPLLRTRRASRLPGHRRPREMPPAPGRPMSASTAALGLSPPENAALAEPHARRQHRCRTALGRARDELRRATAAEVIAAARAVMARGPPRDRHGLPRTVREFLTMKLGILEHEPLRCCCQRPGPSTTWNCSAVHRQGERAPQRGGQTRPCPHRPGAGASTSVRGCRSATRMS